MAKALTKARTTDAKAPIKTTGRRQIAVDPSLDAPKSNPPADEDEGTEGTTEELVTAIVPKSFKLTLDDHTQVQYHAGTQDMPRSHAEHWFSGAMGVEIYEG